MNQSPNMTEEEIKELPVTHQIMTRIVKTPELQDALEYIRDIIMQDRAHQKLNFKPEALYEAAAASGYSLGQLQLISDLCRLGHVITNPN
jgi:hypothetical protein